MNSWIQGLLGFGLAEKKGASNCILWTKEGHIYELVGDAQEAKKVNDRGEKDKSKRVSALVYQLMAPAFRDRRVPRFT